MLAQVSALDVSNALIHRGCPSKTSALKLTWLGKAYSPLPWTVLTGVSYILLTTAILFGFGSFH